MQILYRKGNEKESAKKRENADQGISRGKTLRRLIFSTIIMDGFAEKNFLYGQICFAVLLLLSQWHRRQEAFWTLAVGSIHIQHLTFVAFLIAAFCVTSKIFLLMEISLCFGKFFAVTEENFETFFGVP